MNKQFAVGQKVRFVSANSGAEVGDTGVFLGLGDKGWTGEQLVHVRLDKSRRQVTVFEARLEAVETSEVLKVGDRVAFNIEYNTAYAKKGDTGVLVRIDGQKWDDEIEVLMDRTSHKVWALRKRVDAAPAPKPEPLKVGDRITRKDDSPSFKNLEAVVTKADSSFISFVVVKNDRQYSGFQPGTIATNRPASVYVRLEEAKAEAKEAIKEEPLTPAEGDKVRYNRPGHRWIKDGYMPEGIVVTRRKGAITVKWNTEKDNVTGVGRGTSSDEEYIKKHWEKIEDFTPQPKFKVGDKVRFVKGNGWEGAEAEIVGDAKPSKWSSNFLYEVKIVTKSKASYKEGLTATTIEKNLEGISEFTRKFKFKEGDTVKIVGGYLNGETGKVESITKTASYPYSLKLDSSGSLEAFNERELEAYTPHPLDGAEVGTTITLQWSETSAIDFVMTKIAEDKWRQVLVGTGAKSMTHNQDLSDSSARNHYNDWNGKLVTA